MWIYVVGVPTAFKRNATSHAVTLSGEVERDAFTPGESAAGVEHLHIVPDRTDSSVTGTAVN